MDTLRFTNFHPSLQLFFYFRFDKNDFMEKIKSVGKCFFCNKEFAKAGISRHLSAHLAEKIKEGAPGKSFHVKIEVDPRYGSAPYFLNLWIDSNATFKDLDMFLREIWLECCGHMSSFTNPKKRRGGMWSFFEAEDLFKKGKTAAYEKLMEDQNGEIPKSRKVKDALTKDLKLEYEYDFGSTTKLQITVLDQYPVSVKEKIILLSRNEPLKLMCETCGKEPATQLCTVCISDDGELALCDTCAEKHAEECSDFADYAAMPVVNSPRMGVCGYEGGSIDMERDRVYIKK